MTHLDTATVKIAYNADFGGFSLSDAALAMAQALSGNPDWHYLDVPRHDALLVKVIETLGLDNAGGDYSELCLREVPRGARYRIQEYDGSERVILCDEQRWITAE
jgi:hypothetical protein